MSAELTATVDTLGPYVQAAAVIHGPATSGDLPAHLSLIVKTASALAEAARNAERDAAIDKGEAPVKTIEVTGIVKPGSENNPGRANLCVDAGQKYPDTMWTDPYLEDPVEAQRVKDAVRALAGRTVTVTKETFYSVEHDGTHKVDDKGAWIVRSHPAPGSLFLRGEDGSRTPVDLTAGVTAAASLAAPPAARAPDAPNSNYVSAPDAYAKLTERFGTGLAEAAWGELPRVNNVLRERAENAWRVAVNAAKGTAA